MSDMFENLIEGRQAKRPPCRVAYSLNNAQPVICTIIGDQPLFYMDYDVSFDEDLAEFDVSELGILESEISSLKNHLECMERFTSENDISAEEKLSEFARQSMMMSASENVGLYKDTGLLMEILQKSRLAKAYIDFAGNHGVSIHYEPQIEKSFYDRDSGKILINPSLCMEDQILVTSQELRRHWQHRQGALIHPLMFHPDNAVLINRVQTADLSVSMVRIAWELQLSGERAAWERIENSSMADLARAFAREAFLDFRTLNNGLAAASVFEAWFLSERCRTQDKALINQMLSDYQGYVFDLNQSEHGITPTLIAALGEMPFGKNYLAEHAMTIVQDSIFTDVRDRSNANFLWFIKFERSFRETEQELQTSVGPNAGEMSFPGSADQMRESKNAEEAQIVALFPENTVLEQSGNADKPHKSRRGKARLLSTEAEGEKGNNRQNSNVVYLRRWSAE